MSMLSDVYQEYLERERVVKAALSASEERERVLREALAIAKQIIEGALENGILYAPDKKMSVVLQALATPAPEQPRAKPWGFSGYLEVLPDKPSCPGCQRIGATLFLTDDNLTLCKQCIDSSNEDMGYTTEQPAQPSAEKAGQ